VHYVLVPLLMPLCDVRAVPPTGQKGSDVTAREATRKMVSAATQLDALEKVAARVDAIAAAYGVEVQHMQRAHQLPAGGAAAGKAGAADASEAEQEGLVPRSASAVVQPNLWQPKNTIVRGAFKESVATRTGMLAAVAAGVPMAPPVAGGSAAAAAAAAAGLGAVASGSMGGAAAKGDMFAAATAAAAGGGDAAARRLVGPDVLFAAMQQQQQMLTQSADQECRSDQSHKQHRGR
jgi:hypothetical protein